MKLIDIINKHKDGDEITVWDKTYDLEIYFYKNDNSDEYDKAMNKIASVLDVVELRNNGVVVDLYSLIDKHMPEMLKNLYNYGDTDSIMDTMVSVFSRNYADEEWISKFADILTRETYEVFIYGEDVSFSSYNDDVYYDRNSKHIIHHEISMSVNGMALKLERLIKIYSGYTYGIWANEELIRGGIFDDCRVL